MNPLELLWTLSFLGVPYPARFELPTDWSDTTFKLTWKVNCSIHAPIINYQLEFRELPHGQWVAVNVPSAEIDLDTRHYSNKRRKSKKKMVDIVEFQQSYTIRGLTKGSSYQAFILFFLITCGSIFNILLLFYFRPKSGVAMNTDWAQKPFWIYFKLMIFEMWQRIQPRISFKRSRSFLLQRTTTKIVCSFISKTANLQLLSASRKMRKPTASRYPPATTEEVRKLFFLLLLLLSNRPEKKALGSRKTFSRSNGLENKRKTNCHSPKSAYARNVVYFELTGESGLL